MAQTRRKVKINFLDDPYCSCYEGGFSQNRQIEGYGVMEYKSGIIYSGEFRRGARHGKGIEKDRDGRTWEGTFENGCFNKGTFKNAEIEHEGEFNEKGFHGKGIQKHSDGRTWEGTFENGCLKKGTFKDAEIEYEGEFNEKGYHCKGVKTHRDGRTWEGTFENGLLKKGKVINGSWKYEGEFHKLFLNGEGLLQHIDGRSWKGLFQNDEFVKGEYTGWKIESNSTLHKDGFLREVGSIQAIHPAACNGGEKHFEVTRGDGGKYNLRAEWLDIKGLWIIEADPITISSSKRVLEGSSDGKVDSGAGKKRKSDGDGDKNDMDDVWNGIYALANEYNPRGT
jgi:hypothetical protein